MGRLFLAVALALLACAAPAAAVSPLPVPTLPRDFTWGVAGSAFQSEGGQLESNWHTYNANDARQDRYGTSVDFRHRYKADVELARKMGVTQFRYGINWARVEPREGVWDEGELAYYDDLFRTIKAAGMVPQPTLDHWTYPKWVADQDSWNNPKTVDDWVRFARKIADRYKGQGARWLTFNEAVFYIVSEQARKRTVNPLLMSRHLVKAHRAIYDHLHAVDPQAQVSSNIVWVANNNPLKLASDALFLDGVRDKLDFVAFDYYYESVGEAGLVNILLGRPYETPQYPQGLYVALHELAEEFPGKPIYISENGMPTDDGKPRADGWTRSRALLDGIYWVQRAWSEGIDVRGYQYWSLTDNFEFGSYRPRFGLYQVDVLTDAGLTRKPTDAVATYTAIAKRRGVPAGYAPSQIRCSASGRWLTCPEARDLPQVRTADAVVPTLRVSLAARRARPRGYRLTATVRASDVDVVRVALRRAGRAVLTRRVTVRDGRAVVRFRVRRAGRYAARASAAGAASATSSTLRVGR